MSSSGFKARFHQSWFVLPISNPAVRFFTIAASMVNLELNQVGDFFSFCLSGYLSSQRQTLYDYHSVDSVNCQIMFK